MADVLLQEKDIIAETVTATKYEKTPLRRGKSTWLLYIISAFFAFVLNSLGPLMPFLRSELDFSYTIASFHFSGFALGLVLGSLFGNWFILRLGQKRSLWLGSYGLAVGSLLLTLSPHPAFSIASVLILGLSGALLIILSPIILAARHPGHIATVLTESTVAGSLGGLTAPLALGTIAKTDLGWRSGLLLPMFLLVVLLVVFRKEKFITTAPVTPLIEDVTSAKRGLPKAYWLYWSVMVLVVAVEFSVSFWAADFLEKILKFTKSDAATLMGVFLGAMLIARVAGSFFAQRVNIPRFLVLGCGLTGLGFLLYWLSGIAWLALGGLLLTGLGLANTYPLSLSLALAAAPGQSEVASSRAALASGTAILCAPLLLGTLADSVGMVNAQSIVPFFLVAAIALILNRGSLTQPNQKKTLPA